MEPSDKELAAELLRKLFAVDVIALEMSKDETTAAYASRLFRALDWVGGHNDAP